MNKVIVERPRCGGSRAEPVKTGGPVAVRSAVEEQDDFDSGPKRAPRFDKDKYFNEHLSPLKRFLNGQVGRPWDKVYAEICSGIDRRSVIGAHVLQHVPDYVELPGDSRRWRRGSGLYVNPRTGILLRRKPEPRPARVPKAPTFIRSGPDRAYKKYGDLWFEVTLHEEEDERGWRRIVIDSKRQCNKKEIARIVSADSTSGFSAAPGRIARGGRKR